MAGPRHNLAEKDVENLSAVCSICGPVAIRKNGPRGFICAVKRAESHKAWVEANPGKAAANRKIVSPHKLRFVDGSPVCGICGPVDPQAYGRGETCVNRAREIREIQEAAPQARCGTCSTFLTAAGECLRCEDDAMKTDLDALIRGQESPILEAPVDFMAQELGEAWGLDRPLDPEEPPEWRPGMTVEQMGYKSVVKGWRTIGGAQ